MSSLVNVAMRRAGEGRLDVPVALMMGVAAGALMLMMPDWRLEQAVTATGIAAIFPPASPPLGMTARAIAAVVAALLGFSLAYAAMRLVDRASGLFEPAERAPRDEEEEPAPRMRRRDLHPDAPIRRPLSAMRDLGRPAALEEAEPAAPRRRAPLAAAFDEAAMPRMPWEKDRPALEPESKPRVRKPLLAEPEPEAETRTAEVADVTDTSPESARDEEGVSSSAHEREDRTDSDEFELSSAQIGDTVAAAEPEVAQEQVDEVGVAADPEPVVPKPEPVDFELEVHKPDMVQAEPEPAPFAAGPVPAPAFRGAANIEGVEPARARPDGPETIGELLARLERALDRRQPSPARRQSMASAAPPADESSDPIDSRLRSALENLKRFAPQRG
jgi:hypothetical protein